MPKVIYKCNHCGTDFDEKKDACMCEAKHEAPKYIRIGANVGTVMHLMNDSEGAYYWRQAGLWRLDFKIVDGKIIAVGRG